MSWTFLALSLAELYSILANVYEIRTGKKLPEYDAVWMVLKFMLNTITNKLNNLSSKKYTDVEPASERISSKDKM